jgi:hypothetical protein
VLALLDRLLAIGPRYQAVAAPPPTERCPAPVDAEV